MNFKTLPTLLAVALATLAAPSHAHRPWLYPNVTMVEAKEAYATIDGAISEDLFEVNHMALKLDNAIVIDPDGASSPAPTPLTGRQRSSIELKMTKPGTYKIAVVNKNVMASYKDAKGELKRFRGNEESFAKDVPANAPELKVTRTHQRLETFVSANKLSDGAFKPTGSGLELVPATNPTDLRSGETAKWRFQLDGKPLPNFAFSLIPGGVKYRGVLGEIRLSTDAKGDVAVKLPAPGMYLLNAGFPVSSEKGGGASSAASQNRYSYAATVEILPE